jgi:hypothetical protein
MKKPMTERDFLIAAGWLSGAPDRVAEALRDFLWSHGFEDMARALPDYIEGVAEAPNYDFEPDCPDCDTLEEVRSDLNALVKAIREGRTEDAEKLAAEVEA